ncbi:hypothetical protein BCF55_0869 [Hydrogenivirga caldilitoris]|uniref:Uncharacterized protein n=1 Tax=Hydrogenivirga caldilitoris TaxID=246264 RepID=A0A497XUL9_9AQUI|nr:hypothetical protein [Hydrogenivirga caldilitoris]RLJ70593.1 hypothetical protein BCF55_0869 [Hydrogenivirga caldilitoris]
MVATQVGWAPWLFALLERIEGLPFVESLEIMELSSEEVNTEFSLRIRILEGTDVSLVLPTIVDLITQESWKVYERNNTLPTFFWEVVG